MKVSSTGKRIADADGISCLAKAIRKVLLNAIEWCRRLQRTNLSEMYDDGDDSNNNNYYNGGNKKSDANNDENDVHGACKHTRPQGCSFRNILPLQG